MSALVVGFGSKGSFALGLANQIQNRYQTANLAAMGVEYMRWYLQENDAAADGLNSDWNEISGMENPKVFKGGTFRFGHRVLNPETGETKETVGLLDEERKVNLNRVSKEILVRLFEIVTEMGENKAARIADAILAWRGDEEVEGDNYYGGAKTPYKPKQKEFETLEELLLIPGMTPRIYQALMPYVTVYGTGQVNINTANEIVLRALGIDELSVPRIMEFRSGEDARLGTEDDRVIGSVNLIVGDLENYITIADIQTIAKLLQDGLITIRSSAFRFFVEGISTLNEDDRTQIDVVLSRSGKILYFTEH